MTSPAPVDEEVISKQLLKELSETRFACSSLKQMSTREGNYVYRGILTQPVANQDGTTATSVIIKHCIYKFDAARYEFEETLLESLANFSPLEHTNTVIKAPYLYSSNRETNTQIIQDFGETDGLKWVLLSHRAKTLLPGPSPVIIGHHLGHWLRSFHKWTSAPEQAELQSKIWHSDPVRNLKYRLTYGGFLGVLQDFPEVLEGYQETLETFQNTMAKEFKSASGEIEEEWGIIHGDFWPGNVLIPLTPWQESPQPNNPNKLYIIDWEFAQFGHRSYDLGQLIGDFFERKVFYDLDTALPVLQGILDGYGRVNEDMAFRTVMYVGVHLIYWYIRRPQRLVMSRDVIVAGLKVGRDFILKGWERDRSFFESTVLASLFVADPKP